MRQPRIYTPQSLAMDATVVLSDQAAHHVRHVLRMSVGAPLILFNGTGSAWQGIVVAISSKSVHVSVKQPLMSDKESPLSTYLGQCLSRGNKMDYAIQKATELGVTAITPLFSGRCQVQRNTVDVDKRVKRWQQVAISACEQCGRHRIPVIHSPMMLNDWLQQQDTALKLVLHDQASQGLPIKGSPRSVSLLVGPEGGFTDDEIGLAVSCHFTPVSLGPRILRTETAPVVMMTLMQYCWGDISSADQV